MANPKYHWAVSVLDPSKCRNAWKAHSGGHYARACGRRYANAAFPDSAADFVNRAKRDPDWHCLDCAKAARLALAAESVPKPDAVVWPKPRPISEAPKNGTEIQGFEPDIGWRVVAWTFNAWRLCGAEEHTYNPTHFLPMPAECAGVRTDSERYAELRKLVEAFQSAKSYEDDAPLQALRDWSHR